MIKRKVKGIVTLMIDDDLQDHNNTIPYLYQPLAGLCVILLYQCLYVPVDQSVHQWMS